MSNSWTKIEDGLPKFFEDVIVYGINREVNVLPQCYEARLWTNGYMEKGQWLTPCDQEVVDVLCWMSIPELPVKTWIQELSEAEKQGEGTPFFDGVTSEMVKEMIKDGVDPKEIERKMGKV